MSSKMEGITCFVMNAIGPGPPSHKVVLRVRQEKLYEKNLVVRITKE